MAKHAGIYDTPDYPEGNPLHSTVNKRVLGKMKDQCAGRPITENIGLCSKIYYILEASGKNINKAKDIKRMLWKNTSGMSSISRLSSENRPSTMAWMFFSLRAYWQHLNKVFPSPFDLKR